MPDGMEEIALAIPERIPNHRIQVVVLAKSIFYVS